MFSQYLEILSECPLFQGITKENLTMLLDCLQPTVYNYEKDEYIALMGDPYLGLGIIVGGCATISKESAAGNRVFLASLEPGELFGEMVAFSRQAEWPATVQAQQPCTVFYIAQTSITGQCDKTCTWHTVLVENMLRILSSKGLMLNRRVEYLLIKSMRAKLSAFFLEYVNKTGKLSFVLPMNRNQLAEFLNVSRSSMCREMSRMRAEGVLDFHRSAIQIRDLKLLNTMVE